MPRISQPIPIPSPYGGINTREGIGSLQPHEARSLINWEPSGNSCKPRPGHDFYSEDGASEEPVETLASFNGLAGEALIGVNGGSIWDFSNSVAVELLAAGFTDSRFQTECYNNRLFGVNGTDTPWVYNGTTASTSTGFSGSGLTLSNLTNIAKVRNRLWFTEKNSADVWYGGLGLITGALTKFQLSQVVGGGACIAIGAHSQDAGDGPDDYTAFVMSTGEVVIYAGDPSTTFSKVGNYFMPPPVGKRCLVNIGGPLAVLTHMGLVPLQAAVTGIAFDQMAVGNFGKVSPSIRRDVDRFASLPGWFAIQHEGRIIINVPTSTESSRQWVYNALTGSWHEWHGISAASMAVGIDDLHGLYFGSWSDGVVDKIDGILDRGEPIMVASRGAFAVLPGGVLQTTTGIRFDMAIEGAISGKFGIDTDYTETDLSSYPTLDIASSTASTPWGSPWGSDWSDSSKHPGLWMSAYAEGHSVALAMEATVNAVSEDWLGAHLLTRQTGI
jgi:hypothetical protein